MTVETTNTTTNSYNSTTTSSSSASETSKNEFLKLLTYQLKTQNPMKPYDNQEFAAQLAQFSQLEQLVDIRSMIEEQINSNSVLTKTMANSALPGMIGKQAKALTDTTNFDGENNVKLGYSLPYPAYSGTMSIYDSAGNKINEIKLDPEDLTRDDHLIEWDGTDSDGNTVDAGKYYFDTNFGTQNGTSFSADTFVQGKIEAVRFKSEGTFLVVNGVETALEKVTDISN